MGANLCLVPCFGARAFAEPVRQVPDEDNIAILPRARWPQAPASARPRDTLPALPSRYWASALRQGEVRTIDGVLSARQPSDTVRRFILAGVLQNLQPTINLEPAAGDTGTARRNARRQSIEYLNWSARYFGRQLPEARRRQLAGLYRAAAETAAAVTARRPQSRADAASVRT